MIYIALALACLIIGSIIGYFYRDIAENIKGLQGNNEAKPAQIIRSNPAKALPIVPDNGGSVVIIRKTPEQIEKEEEAEADRLVSL